MKHGKAIPPFVKQDAIEILRMVPEEEFEIEIPDEVAEKIQTVGDAIEHIKKLKA